MSPHAGSPGGDASMRTDPETLSSWLLNSQHIAAPSARGNLTILLNAVCVACKFVQSAVRKAGLAGVLGLAGGSQNVQGEDQKKLDIIANDVFISCLGRSGQVAAMVSEEDDEPIVVEGSSGDYVVVFDPLDGSSNIDCGVSIGTIFGIYRKGDASDGGAAATPPASTSSRSPASAALRPGRDLVAAGYCLYGSSCMLVLCVGGGGEEPAPPPPPSVFTLDPSLGEFVLTQARVKVPERGSIYSINEGNALLWDEGTRRYVEKCKGLDGDVESDGEVRKPPMSARYVGSMVADVHRTLLYGGVFCYPADKKSRNGKLRLLYEGAPMARIVTAAGGRAIAGPGVDVLDLDPREGAAGSGGGYHGRCPVFLGSRGDVGDVEAFLAADPEHLQARK